jgi:hypothetical protein
MKITKMQLKKLIKEAIQEQASPFEIKDLGKEMNDGIRDLMKSLGRWSAAAGKAADLLEGEAISSKEHNEIISKVLVKAYNITEEVSEIERLNSDLQYLLDGLNKK